MGAWGNRNFENDQAMDFAGDFIDNPSTEELQKTFAIIIELGQENKYIVDEASAALAAAEIVAAKLRKPAPDFPESLQPTLAAIQLPASLQKLAREAVNQVMTESELRELWVEAGELDDWLAIQTDLLERLK